MSSIPAASWVALGVSAASALLLLVSLVVIRCRERAIDWYLKRLQDVDARTRFTAAAAQAAGQSLLTLRREHERLKTDHARLSAELERCRAQLATARAALAHRGDLSQDDTGDPTTFVKLDGMPSSSREAV